jgi:hypothetical protein
MSLLSLKKINNRNNKAINPPRAKMLGQLLMSVNQTGVLFPLTFCCHSHDHRRFHHLFTAAVVAIFSYQQKIIIIS